MFAVVPELNSIKRSLCVVDFELPDTDKDMFFVYALNNMYNKKYPYPYDYTNEYRPPKYFRTLLKQIKPLCLPIE